MSTMALNQNKINPQKFVLWLGIAGIIMLFASLTSAYIVRKSAGDWINFKLPSIFWINTFIILLSSVSIQWAYIEFKRYHENSFKIAMLLTLALGFTFLIGQYIGWKELSNMGIFLSGNPSGSFVYVISGVHAAHILGGLVFILLFTIKSFTNSFNPNRLVKLEMLTIYWHFVDILWIYLFIFFQINIV